jgi:hypothetical protein
MRTKAVDSSYLKSLRYFEDTKVLRCHFYDGALIDYFGISPQTYRAITSAESHGEAFTRLVRDKYAFKIVREAR